jgi:recombination protein RecA
MAGKASKVARRKAAKPAAKPSESDDIVADVLEGIRDEIGEDGAQVLGSDVYALKIRGVISTQCPTLDAAIGRGGIPLSRLTILHGAEGSGKTTIALHIVAETQRMGGVVVYVDKEYKLDPDYAVALGVNTKKFIISYPKTAEQVVKLIKGIIKRAAAARAKTGRRPPILVVVDSLNACIAKAVLEGEEEDHHIAPEARVWSRNLPEIIELCHKEDVALLFISQVRSKIGVLFGSAEEICGGNAPRFFASLIMYVKRVGTEKTDGSKTGALLEVECKKNQIAPPFKKAKAVIKYGKGVDFEQSLILQAEHMGIVEKSGAWFSYEGERIGQGYNASGKALRKNPKWRDQINRDVRVALGWETHGEA